MTTNHQTTRPLRRLLGTPTAIFVGMGVAIGSGVFRVPGEVAGAMPSSSVIVFAWIVGGMVNLVMSLVTAELATRYPQAGGEYVYLREAYGEFVAFFFGWGYTVFVIGGGAATIALALGDFSVELFGLSSGTSGVVAAGAIVLVTGLNALGLRASALIQNGLTVGKLVALLSVVVVCFLWGREPVFAERAVATGGGGLTASMMLGGFMAALWPYMGSTDAAKLAEEVKDVRRAMPLALLASALALTGIYVLVNVALLRAIPAGEMHQYDSVLGEAMGRLVGERGRTAMLVAAVLVCLGSLSSTVLATIRVTFALARDGLTFRFMAYMTRGQAPLPALVVVASVSIVLVLTRDFRQVLGIYFLASSILFGLTYGSLIIFRLRENTFPAHVFRCPLGIPLAVALIALQIALAVNIIMVSFADAVKTLIVLAVLGLMYFVWKRF